MKGLRRTKTLVLWGLKGSVTLRLDGDELEVRLEHPDDAAFVDGFVTGLRDMPRLDLARRLWSGRLSEFLGLKPLGTLDAYRLDVAIRGLGFFRRSQRAFRRLLPGDRELTERWATGVNAWIDQQDLPQSPTYRRLGSLPRLMGAAEILLLHRAPREVVGTGTAQLDGAPGALWAALSSPALRAPGSVGDVPVGLPSPGEELGTFVAPSVTPRTVLERDDGHLFIDPRGDGTPRRLLVDRPNVSVRGEPVHRPWIRRAPEGWLISDALVDAAGPTPPVGPAQVFEWPVVGPAVPTPVVHAPLSPDHLWRVHAAEPPRRLRLELVPKRG